MMKVNNSSLFLDYLNTVENSKEKNYGRGHKENTAP